MVYCVKYLTEDKLAYFCRKNPGSLVLTLPCPSRKEHDLLVNWFINNQNYTYDEVNALSSGQKAGDPSIIPGILWGHAGLMFGSYSWLQNDISDHSNFTIVRADFVESAEESLFKDVI